MIFFGWNRSAISHELADRAEGNSRCAGSLAWWRLGSFSGHENILPEPGDSGDAPGQDSPGLRLGDLGEKCIDVRPEHLPFFPLTTVSDRGLRVPRLPAPNLALE